MSQTLLTLLAMMLVTLFSFNQQRSHITARMRMIHTEIDLRATDAATSYLEEMGDYAFDEATLRETISGPDELTPQGGNGFTADTSNNDLDDLDGVVITRRYIGPVDSLTFQLSTRVTYVEPAELDTEASHPTKFKRIVVSVHSLDVPFPDTLRLSQVYSCNTSCDW